MELWNLSSCRPGISPLVVAIHVCIYGERGIEGKGEGGLKGEGWREEGEGGWKGERRKKGEGEGREEGGGEGGAKCTSLSTPTVNSSPHSRLS